MSKMSTLTIAFFLTAVCICSAGVVYQSPEKMWDTWVLDNDGEYHLFFLSRDNGIGNIGRAVSKDLIHWKHLPPIKNMAKKGDWDELGMMMTGCTVKHGNKYYLSYGARSEGTPIGLLESDDLVNWKRVGDPVLTAKPPYHKSHWRDLSPIWNKEKQQWDGYLFGIHAKTSRPAIACVTSKDFLKWEYQEPLFISEEYTRDNNGFVYLEVPDLFEMGGKYYVTFSSIRSRKNATSGRLDASGTWYIMADKKEGPYRVPKNPLLLGTGLGRYDHYVGRTIVHKGKRLMYHQNWGKQRVDWSTPKLVEQDENNELYLKYWPDLDVLKTKQLLKEDSISVKSMPTMRFQEHEIKTKATDFMLTCNVHIKDAKSLSIFWRRNEMPFGLKIEPATETFSIVQLHRVEKFNSNTYHTLLKDQYTNKNLFTDKMAVRILVRKGRSEVYINDRWVFNVGLKDIPATGDFSLLVDSGEAQVNDLEIHELEPLVLDK